MFRAKIHFTQIVSQIERIFHQQNLQTRGEVRTWRFLHSCLRLNLLFSPTEQMTRRGFSGTRISYCLAFAKVKLNSSTSDYEGFNLTLSRLRPIQPRMIRALFLSIQHFSSLYCSSIFKCRWPQPRPVVANYLFTSRIY